MEEARATSVVVFITVPGKVIILTTNVSWYYVEILLTTLPEILLTTLPGKHSSSVHSYISRAMETHPSDSILCSLFCAPAETLLSNDYHSFHRPIFQSLFSQFTIYESSSGCFKDINDNMIYKIKKYQRQNYL